MDELARLVAQKTGISEEQARMAVTMIVNFLKERLPAPIAAQVDGVLGNAANGQGVIKGLEGFFGKK
jgi:hypothetical protein